MLRTAELRYLMKKLKDYLAVKTDMVNHQDIIRDVASGVERSWIYYLMLLMAGLIALLGLLTNSVAVVIGAMLISPLMGPIISSGLALTIGDLPLARRAFRTIAVSVVLTILVTALVTLISPLKDPTAEILARVRPNIYDLFVAVLSGIVGAVALCTKRNYLITATGVAVATAVIPPLSVVGYGLGTGQIMLGMGGFLLFFTNFVAIVLTSDLIFFVMGFRTSHVETIQYSQRTRLLIIGGLLALISIPLVYTLVVDLQKVNNKKRIERALKKHLNQEQVSRMTGYTYRQDLGKLLVRATVNTVAYIGKETEQKVESELQLGFKTPVDLQLEQVLVASGQLPEHNDVKPQEETAAEISAKAGKLVTKAERALAASMAPFPVSDTRLSFSDGSEKLKVTAILHRDWPAGADELVLLSRQLEQTLELPVELFLTPAPLLPPLRFADDGSLTSESIKSLAALKRLPGGPVAFRFELAAVGRQSGKQLAQVRQHLIGELGTPAEAISSQQRSARGVSPGTVALRIARKETP